MPRARLSAVERTTDVDSRVFVDEALSRDPVMLDRLSGEARAWAELRIARSPAEAPEFHGSVAASGDRRSTEARARPWSVSALETYLDCPFKFFARHVLALVLLVAPSVFLASVLGLFVTEGWWFYANAGSLFFANLLVLFGCAIVVVDAHAREGASLFARARPHDGRPRLDIG